jgi:hypothetical protein
MRGRLQQMARRAAQLNIVCVPGDLKVDSCSNQSCGRPFGCGLGLDLTPGVEILDIPRESLKMRIFRYHTSGITEIVLSLRNPTEPSEVDDPHHNGNQERVAQWDSLLLMLNN